VPTDRLFTGQRLDDTGLYYYGARYYDPQIGRFISPDTLVHNFANPQSFNRYSYCLNNPLKYIDPTGFDPEGDPYADGALGWTSDEGWFIGQGGDWYPIAEEAVDFFVSSFIESEGKTWSEFMGGIMADFIPGNIATLTPDNYPSTMWALLTFELNGNTYMWSIQQQYNEAKRAAESRLTIVEANDLTTEELIVACNQLAFAGDIISFFGPVGFVLGYTLSTVTATIGYVNTAREYRAGNISETDMMRAHINYAFGLWPGFGIIPAGAQVIMDTRK
jgi:RHS repeat-associated protein